MLVVEDVYDSGDESVVMEVEHLIEYTLHILKFLRDGGSPRVRDK